MSDTLGWAAGWTSLLVAVAAAAAVLATLARVPLRFRTLVVGLVLLGVLFVPLGRTAVIAMLFGAFGPLSLASVLASCAILARFLGGARGPGHSDLLYCGSVTAGLGLVLYPAATGFMAFDPYRWGFHGLVFPIMLIVLALIGLWLRSRLFPLWVSLAVLAWLGRVYGSGNLWDYLIDPVAWVSALVFLLAQGGLALLAPTAPAR